MTVRAFEIAGGFGFEALKLAQRAQPEAGRRQVLVRLRALSLNYRDLLVVKGLYSKNLQLPLVPLSDGAGEVAAVGPEVTRFAPGDRVAGIFMQSWLGGPISEKDSMSALGGAIDGMAADYVALHEDGLVRVPGHLSFEEAAALPCAAVTAWNALIEGGVRPGETVLVMGTGGVSLFALQFARLAGARVIMTSSSDEKLDRAAQLGASAGINYQAEPDWEKRVREWTGGVGVDHVVEVGGAGTMGRSLRAVRTGGCISLIGVLAGGAAEFNPIPILMKSVTVRGIHVGSRAMFEAMNRAIGLHRLRPVIDRVFPFADLPDALRYLESAAHFGKVVISMDS